MALIGGRQIGISESDTITVQIPDNPIAHLMYYLETIDNLINAGFPSRIKNYLRYYDLTVDEQAAIIVLSAAFSIDKFIDNHIIVIAPELTKGSSNAFYEISDTRVNVFVDRQCVIGDKKVTVLKIMAIKEKWAIDHFFNPMKFFMSQLKPEPTPIRSSYSYSRIEERSCCSSCLLI